MSKGSSEMHIRLNPQTKQYEAYGNLKSEPIAFFPDFKSAFAFLRRSVKEMNNETE